MKKIKFLLDSLDPLINPQMSKDYNSVLIQSFLFKPLFYASGSSWTENGIRDLSSDGIIRLKFLDDYWSDNSKITAFDFYKTIALMLKENGVYASYLNFIVGVKEYLNADATFENIKMWVNNNIFYAEVYSLDFYKDIFSSINFCPLKINKNRINYHITSGKYELGDITRESITLRLSDRNNNKNLPEIVEFCHVKNGERQLEIVKRSSNVYSGITSLTGKQILFSDVPINKLKSGVSIRLVFNRNLFAISDQRLIVYELQKRISQSKELSKVIEIKQRSINKSEFNRSKKKVKLIYPKYYPNNYIVDLLKIIMDEFGCQLDVNAVDLDEFMCIQKEKYDLILELVNPISENVIDRYISEIPYFSSDTRKEFINILNSKISNIDIFKNDCQLDDFILTNSNCRLIGYLNHFYAKSEKLPKLNFTRNGILLL